MNKIISMPIELFRATLKTLASMVRCEYCSIDCVIAKNGQDYDEDLCLQQLIDYAIKNPTEE